MDNLEWEVIVNSRNRTKVWAGRRVRKVDFTLRTPALASVCHYEVKNNPRALTSKGAH